MKELPHYILEVANNHGGDADVIKELINQCSKLEYPDLGIKFQAFNYDTLALPDYSWYDVYRKLFNEEKVWKEILELAHKKIGKVWLDIFDVYGLKVLSENRDKIWGIKLQPSVVNNIELIEHLRKMDLKDKELILNLSGYEISEIEDLLAKFQNFNFKKMVLQIGFQSYPTKIEDTSLRKIELLKAAFPHLDLSFADHIGAEDKFAQQFPVYAYIAGCAYIEKHACVSRKESKYDQFSSLELEEIKNVLSDLKKAQECLVAKFLPESEKKYLASTYQKPVIKTGVNPGQLISDSDLIYRRTDKKGIYLKDIQHLQSNFFVLNRSIDKNDILTKADFKKARIGVVVVAALEIGGLASLESCLQKCLEIQNIDEVVLPTSTLEEDSMLKKYTLEGQVKFFQGDPNDVISYFIGAAKQYNLDVIIRVNANSPLVAPEIVDTLLKAHFASGADYTGPREFSIGTNSDIFNVEGLKRIIQHIGEGHDTASMDLFMKNNPHIFKSHSISQQPANGRV